MLRQAEQKDSMVREGPRKEDIAGARADVARAQAAVKTAEANRLEVQRREQELGEPQSEIQRTEAQAGISRIATCRYDSLFAGGRRSAGESSRCG